MHTPSGPGHNAGYTGTGDKADLDNHSKNLNPEYAPKPREATGTGDKADNDNHSNQMNPNNAEYKGNKK